MAERPKLLQRCGTVARHAMEVHIAINAAVDTAAAWCNMLNSCSPRVPGDRRRCRNVAKQLQMSKSCPSRAETRPRFDQIGRFGLHFGQILPNCSPD